MDCSSQVPGLVLSDVLQSALALSQCCADPHLVWWHLWVSSRAGTVANLPINQGVLPDGKK